MRTVDITHFHIFCGLGGGAKGFNAGQARVGNVEARFKCLGGIDVDPAGMRDFEKLAGVPGTVMDLFSIEQYVAFHGHMPPTGWRAATPSDIHRAAQNETPHIVFLSAPCKGFSGLLSESMSLSTKYQALNELTLRGIWLTLEAFKDDAVSLVVFENVPRIMTRGRHLLDQIVQLLRHYGYAVNETTHDCGEIGGLAQSRKRFLLVARHEKKVPPFLYVPDKHRLKPVSDILSKMPMPGDLRAGPMHRVPTLQWKTWVRLAMVEAGSDWRSLNRLRVVDGKLADYAIVPEHLARAPSNDVGQITDIREQGRRNDYLGVSRWSEHSGTVSGGGRPGNGGFCVEDPRVKRTSGGAGFNNVYRVIDISGSSPAITGGFGPTAGGLAINDPTVGEGPNGPHFKNVYRIVGWDNSAPTVSSGHGPSSGGTNVADPRPAEGAYTSKYRVTKFNEASGTVIAASTTGQGAFAVAEPRTSIEEQSALDIDDPRCPWKEGAHTNKHKVLTWAGHSTTITGSVQPASGGLSVADPRHSEGDISFELPKPEDRLVAVIRSPDNTWHRPLTTLELAALQGLIDPDEDLTLDGQSESSWRERIGNAVPPKAARAIASMMGRTLLLAWSGQTFSLSSSDIWVRQVAIALSVDTSEQLLGMQ